MGGMADSSTPAILHSYIFLQEIGTGAYGTVYKAREDGGEQRMVAIKELNLGADPQGGIPDLIIREAGLLRRLEHHPNVVKLFETFAGVYIGGNVALTLVFEYIDQDLSAYISKVPIHQGLGLGKIKELMVQLLHGLDFLHANNMVHRDLKPENILVSSSGQVKIADFGLTCLYTYMYQVAPGVVTLWYRAPEVLLGSVYTSTVDMWSAGCILAELFLLKPLFQAGYSEAQQLHKIFQAIGLSGVEDWPGVPWGPGAGLLPDHGQEVLPGAGLLPDLGQEELPGAGLLPDLGQEGNDLLTQCLVFEPTSRISASEALAHPFFNEIFGSPATPQEP